MPALVHSGRARDKITSPGHFKVVKYGKAGASGRIINVNSIRYFWIDQRMRKKNPGPNMAAEVTVLSKDEEEQIKLGLQNTIADELEKTSQNRRVIRR